MNETEREPTAVFEYDSGCAKAINARTGGADPRGGARKLLRARVLPLVAVLVALAVGTVRGQADTSGAAVDSATAPGAVDTSAIDSAAVADSVSADSVDAPAAPDSVDTGAAPDTTASAADADTTASAADASARPTSAVLDTLSREVLARVVNAYLSVQALRPVYRERYGTSGATPAADTTYRAFRRAAEAHIRQAGMAPSTYRGLMRRAQTDELLRRALLIAVRTGGDSLLLTSEAVLGPVPSVDSAGVDSTAVVDSAGVDSSAAVDSTGATASDPAGSGAADTIRTETAGSDTSQARPVDSVRAARPDTLTPSDSLTPDDTLAPSDTLTP